MSTRAREQFKEAIAKYRPADEQSDELRHLQLQLAITTDRLTETEIELRKLEGPPAGQVKRTRVTQEHMDREQYRTIRWNLFTNRRARLEAEMTHLYDRALQFIAMDKLKEKEKANELDLEVFAALHPEVLLPPPKEEEEGPSSTQKADLILMFDGGCRGNGNKEGTSESSAAWMLKNTNQEMIACGFKYLPLGLTNNEAEYNALIEGLTYVQVHWWGRMATLEVRGDSKLVVFQVNGHWKIEKKHLSDLAMDARARINDLKRDKGLRSFELNHIRREENGRADFLANIALDEKRSATYEADQSGGMKIFDGFRG